MIKFLEKSLALPSLPEALHGLRIAHLSDIHRGPMTPDALIHRAVAKTKAACPDLILLTGDYVDRDPADIAPCARMLAALQAPLGVYAVLGNHDYRAGGPDVARALAHVGITMLDNRSIRLENGLWLAGLDDPMAGRPDIPRAFSGIGIEELVFTLCHSPAYAENLADRNTVVFSGHTHGGQVVVPMLTARKLRSIGAKHYTAGWYRAGKARIYVSRGVGNTGVSFRFRAPSEIALFTLESEPSHQTQKS